MLRAGTRRRVALLLRVIGATVVIGAVIGGANGVGFRDAPLLGVALGALGGATNGVLLMGAILGAEILLPPTRLGHALERVPFLVNGALKFLVYGALIVLVVGGRPGGHLARAAAAVLLSPDLAEAMYAQRAPRAVLVASIFLLLANAILVLQISRLVGERTLRDIVLGRYHRSRTEERIFPIRRHRRLDAAGRAHRPRRGPSVSGRSLPACLGPDRRSPRRGLSIRRRRDRDHLDGGRGARRRPTDRLLLRHRAGGRAGRAGVRARVWRGAAPPRRAARQFLVSGDVMERLWDLGGFAFEDLGLQRLRGRAAAMCIYVVTPKPLLTE